MKIGRWAVIGCTVLGCWVAGVCHGQTMGEAAAARLALESFFADAVSTTTVGETYTSLRGEILKREGAEEFLREKAALGADGPDRRQWLRERVLAEEDVPLLLEIALKGPTGDVAEQLELVAHVAVPPAWQMDGDYRLWARATAALFAGYRRDAEVAALLRDLALGAPEPPLRVYALRGLARQGPAESVETLIAALGDPVERVGESARWMLRNITGQKFEPRHLNPATVAPQYRAWWEANKEDLLKPKE